MRAASSSDGEPNAIEWVGGEKVELEFETARCIHSRYCVTWAPRCSAPVQGPWIHPDEMDVERVVEVAHACPSGAIRYRRLDGKPQEAAPPVNLCSIREGGPYALRAQLELDGKRAGYRVTLGALRCSKNKPFCDGSHQEE